MDNEKLSRINGKYILKGPTGSGKSEALFKRYKYLVEDLNVSSDSILILLLNRTQSLDWRKKTILKKSGLIWRTSYYGFIQNEINTFYPMIVKNCSFIGKKRLKPIFLTFESAQYIVSKVIEKRREREGLFSGVTSFSDRISIDLTANLVKAAISDISFDSIGERMYNSLEKKDKQKKKTFIDSDNILKAYRKKCLELGVFDFGIAIYLYNNFLLNDKNYLDVLFKRVKHIIVDDVEEAVPSEVDFIKFLMPKLKSCYISYNYEGGYGSIFGGNHEYMKRELLNSYPFIELNKTYTSNDFLIDFADKLYLNISTQNELKVKNSCKIEKTEPVELRSEMLENIGHRIIKLLTVEGYKPSDIVVLSSYADPVTEYVIERVISRFGYEIKNLARKSKVIDSQFTKALITLAQICHPSYNIIPTKDDVTSLIRLLLKIDPIRSSILANEIIKERPFAKFPDIENSKLTERIGYFNLEKYNYIKEWISIYKQKEPIPINEFFQKVFLEILLSSEIPQTNILQAKNLIDSAGNFIEVCGKFNMNGNKDFLDMIKKGIKASESIFELEEKLSGDFVLLSTSSAYLAASLESKIIILTGISSENWTPRNMKEFTNNHVLTKTWNEKLLYTEEMEDKNKSEYMATLLRAVIKRCNDKIITFESNLSAGGYENNGILSEYFDYA
ncbi:MAG: UvrD-helicase domain-containing protein [Clostridiales bacterium]